MQVLDMPPKPREGNRLASFLKGLDEAEMNAESYHKHIPLSR
jgi:hypothetical protein